MNTNHICTCESLSWVGFIEDPCKPKKEDNFFYTTEEGIVDLPQTGVGFDVTSVLLIASIVLITIGVALRRR